MMGMLVLTAFEINDAKYSLYKLAILFLLLHKPATCGTYRLSDYTQVSQSTPLQGANQQARGCVHNRHPFITTVNHVSIQVFIHSCVHSIVQSFIHAPKHACRHSSTHSFIHSLTRSLLFPRPVCPQGQVRTVSSSVHAVLFWQSAYQ